MYDVVRSSREVSNYSLRGTEQRNTSLIVVSLSLKDCYTKNHYYIGKIDWTRVHGSEEGGG